MPKESKANLLIITFLFDQAGFYCVFTASYSINPTGCSDSCL